VKSYVRKIGPAEAEELLEGNMENRNISQEVVDRYTLEMKEGRWLESGNTISIYKRKDGTVRLLNGQHRLLGVVFSGITIHFVIVEEDTEDVFKVFDSPYVRTTAQVLSLMGMTNVNARQSMARFVINYESHIGSSDPWSRRSIPTTRVIAWLEQQDERMINAVMADYTQMRSRDHLTNTWYAGLDFLVRSRSKQPEQWLIFHEGYVNGSYLKADSPIYALKTYTANRSRPQGRSGRYQQSAWDRQAHLAVAIRAWNDFTLDETAKVYRFQKNWLPMPGIS
jgi:hypothetical protein